MGHRVRRLELGADGFVKECEVDEVGMLLARARTGEQTSTIPLRGVFAREDAWLVTGDLFDATATATTGGGRCR